MVGPGDERKGVAVSADPSPAGRGLFRHPAGLVSCLLALLLGVAVSHRLAMLNHQGDVTDARARVSATLDRVRAALSRDAFAAVNLTEGLVTLVSLKAGVQQDEFDALAAAIVRRSPVTRNVALAVGTTITFVYPLDTNRAALGVDYLKTPDQREGVLRAIRERRTVVAGPLQLVQGGTGIIGRTPIFVRAPGGGTDAGDHYWGIAATVISFDRLIESAGLNDPALGLRIGLRGRDGEGASGEPFWGDAQVFAERPVQLDVPLPSGSWVIAAVPVQGWPLFRAWRSSSFVAGCALSITLSCLLLSALLASHDRRLEVQARKQSEDDLREVNRTLLIKEFAIESATSGMALADLAGRIVYVNSALAAMLGGPPSSSIGRPIDEVWPGASLGTTLVASGAWRGEVTVPDPSGAARTLEGVANTVCGPSGETLCRILSFQDVTERKRMLAEVERSQRLAALSLFAGGVAHDFNNLLAGLFGNVELARAALPEDSPAAAHLDTAAVAFERARDLTRRLLTFAIGRPPARRHVAVSEFLNECCALSLSGSNTSWQIETACGEPLRDVLGDANQLSQVFTNILVNARQAMPDGGRVAISLRNRDIASGAEGGLPAGRYVEIAVTDDGPGIPSDVLPRVFEPFYTTKADGSGLGLAMTYSIVHAHGGRVSALSREGAGTTILVLLPAAEPLLDSRPVPRPADPPAAAHRERILLMDDEKLVRDIASRMLARGGYEIVAVCDGAEAVDMCERALAEGRPFDAAILDVTVQGGMGGWEALKRLRDLHPGLAVVLSSGYSELGPSSAECQPTAVLPKPYQMHELLACARAVVSPRRSSYS